MVRPLALLLALVCLPFSQSISRAQGDETRIIALENLWNQMQVNHDADAMGSMLDNVFVLTDYDGTVHSKEQFLAIITDKSIQLTVEVSEDRELHRHGDTVIVTGSTREKGRETIFASRPLHRYLDQEGRPVVLHCESAQFNRQVAPFVDDELIHPLFHADASRTQLNPTGPNPIVSNEINVNVLTIRASKPVFGFLGVR